LSFLGKLCSLWLFSLDPDSNTSVFSRVRKTMIRKSSPNGMDYPVGVLKAITARLAEEKVFFYDSVVVRTETVKGVRL
jgi:hypothetical protein